MNWDTDIKCNYTRMNQSIKVFQTFLNTKTTREPTATQSCWLRCPPTPCTAWPGSSACWTSLYPISTILWHRNHPASLEVSPVHKKGSKHDPGSYRTVSLTSIICKIQEHIIVSSMFSRLEEHGIQDPDQHGFHKRLCTETQLIQAVHDWANTIKDKGQTDVFFLDFSKAFDTVLHKRLVMKLSNYGIGGKPNTWVAALLQ